MWSHTVFRQEASLKKMPLELSGQKLHTTGVMAPLGAHDSNRVESVSLFCVHSF